MSFTSRKRRPLNRKIEFLRDTRLVIIATEGHSTEKQYFTIFEKRSPRVQVTVLGTEDGLSAPKHVLNRLKKFREDNDIRKEDALCLAIDKDRWPDAQLSDVAAKAQQMSVILAVSRPCFELWLFLHHSDVSREMDNFCSEQMIDTLAVRLGGYSKDSLRKDIFEPHIQQAVERARALDVDPHARWPNSLGTRVYRIIEAIRNRE